MAKVKENGFLAILKIFKKLGETEYIDEEEKIDTPEYKESSFLSDLKKQASSSIQSETDKKDKKGGKSGGLKKKYDTPTIDVEDMSKEKLEAMRKKLEKGQEREIE